MERVKLYEQFLNPLQWFVTYGVSVDPVDIESRVLKGGASGWTGDFDRKEKEKLKSCGRQT